MKNKILIGSIIAITILVGVSFTSVVGYNSVESNIGVSPLFNVRSSRAIDVESEDLSCAYVGKGEDINLLILDRDDKSELIRKAIESFSQMDDDKFDRFVAFIIHRINEDYIFNYKNRDKVIFALDWLRVNEQEFEEIYISDLFSVFNNPDWCLTIRCATLLGEWFPTCRIVFWLIDIFLSIWDIIDAIGLWISANFHYPICS
jgi:hypothetical protein